jgi:hypothetical protein
MAYFHDLPRELLNEIFTLREVSRLIKSAIDNHTKLWSLYLDKSDLATAKKQKISYWTLSLEKHF